MGSIYDWSTTAASNATADSDINWAEGQDPGTVNDSAREMMRKVATFRAMVGGEKPTTGSGTAYLLTYNHAPAAYVQGFYVCFEAHASSGATATLNVNGLGAISLRDNTGAAISTGDLVAGSYYMATYDAALGQFFVLNVSGIIANLTVVTSLTVNGGSDLQGTVDVGGAFTSLGILDAASAQYLHITDTGMNIGAGSAASGARLGVNTVSDAGFEIGAANTHALGANLELFGSTHATLANHIILSTGNTDRLQYDFGNTRWDFLGQIVTGVTELTITGNFNSLSMSDTATATTLSLADTTLTLGNAAAYAVQRDVADQSMAISGGSSVSNGSNWTMFGGSHATRANDAELRSGSDLVYSWDDSTGTHTFYNAAGTSVMTLDGNAMSLSGNLDILGAHTLDLSNSRIENVGVATVQDDAPTARQVQNSSLMYAGTITGTNTYAATLGIGPVLVAGFVMRGIVTNANTAASTLATNGAGPISIVKGVNTALDAGDIAAGELCEFLYDGTNWILQDVAGEGVTEANVVAALDGATLTAITVAATDKVLLQDASDADNLKTATAQSIADLASGGGAEPSDTQTFTGSGTWTKPGAGYLAVVECWGGGGAGGQEGGTGSAGGGGGGGGYVKHEFLLTDLGATETVTIGAGGTAGAATGVGATGNPGGNTTFGSLVTAYGGGGGSFAATGGGGGGGGGIMSAGSDGVNAIGGGAGDMGGGPGDAANSANDDPADPPPHPWGGAGGGGGTDSTSAGQHAGGAAYYGGGGGGGGNRDAAPGPGAGGVSLYGGNGGAGAFDTAAATAGTQPGGGGGGAEDGIAGAGAAGQCIVRVYD